MTLSQHKGTGRPHVAGRVIICLSLVGVVVGFSLGSNRDHRGKEKEGLT